MVFKQIFDSIRLLILSCIFLLIITGTILLIRIATVDVSAVTVPKLLKQHTAIVLLAGSHEERIPRVATLYERGYTGRILLTNDGVLRGWSHVYQRNLFSIEQAEDILINAGVPVDTIIKLPFRRSGTVYDALAVRDYIRLHPLPSIIIVTSDYHSDRALWIFERVLADMPVSIMLDPVLSSWSPIIPILLEPMKLVYYRVRFGLFGLPT